MVTFKNVQIEGFGSIQSPFDFLLDRRTINLISAPNGSGKTTIFSALCWALYGVPLKKIPQGKIPTRVSKRGKDFKGTRVVVNLENEQGVWSIARHIKYSGNTFGRELHKEDRLLILLNGVEDTSGNKGIGQSLIDKDVMGMSYDVFIKTVLFGQKMKRFIEEDNKEKREFFDTLFDLGFVDLAKEKAEVKMSEQALLLADLNQKIAISRGKLESVTSKILEIEGYILRDATIRNAKLVELATSYANKQAEITNTKQHIDAAEIELINLADKIKHLGEAVDEASIAGQVNLLNTTITGLNSTIATINLETTGEYNKLVSLKNALVAKQLDLDNQKSTKLVGYDKEFAQKLVDEKAKLEEETRLLLVPIDTYIQLAVSNKTQALNDIQQYEIKIREGKKHLTEIADVCPTCGQEIKNVDPEQLRENVRTLIAVSENTVKLLNESIRKYDEEQEKQKQLKYNIANEHRGNLIKAENRNKEILDNTKRLHVIDKDYEVDWTEHNQLSAKYTELYNANAAKIASNQAAIDIHKTSIRILQESLQSDELKNATAEKANKTLTLNTLRHNLTTLEAELSGIVFSENELKEAADNPYTYDIDNVRVSEETLTLELNAINGELVVIQEEYNQYQFLAAKVFTSLGVKSAIFSAMLYMLNEAVEFWASKLGYRIVMSVDTTKMRAPINTTVTMDGDDVDYEELSGGESQRINVCLAFGLYDLVASTVGINILILDEVFEGLDVSAIDLISNIIKEKANDGKSIYIITHNPFLDIPFSRRIDIKKDEHGTIEG